MVLHRKQTEGGIKALYKSSNILASIYSESTKGLENTFKKLDDVDPKSIEESILTYRSAEIDNLYTNGLSDILSLIDGAPEKYDNKILNTIADKCSKLIVTIKQYG